MARVSRKKTATPPVVTDDTIELANLDIPPLSPREEQQEREVEEFAAELGSTGRVKVWSIIDGRATYAGDMSADGFTLDALMDTYGGGEKSLVFMQGKAKIETVRVSLDPTIPAKNPRVKTPATAAANGGPSLPDLAGVFASMAASQMQNAQMVTTMITGMMTAMTSVLAASKPTSDPTDTALRIAEVLKGGNGGGDMAAQLALFREGIKLGEQLGGKEDDGYMSVVGKGMDTLGVLVQGIVAAQKEKPAQSPPALPSGVPPTDEIPADERGDVFEIDRHRARVFPNNETPSVSVRPWVDAARPNIGALLNASKFLPPHAAAAAIDNMLSDEQFEDLINDIQNQDGGGFGVRLREYFPGHIDDNTDAQWIGEVVRILLTDYVEEDEEGATP